MTDLALSGVADPVSRMVARVMVRRRVRADMPALRGAGHTASFIPSRGDSSRETVRRPGLAGGF